MLRQAMPIFLILGVEASSVAAADLSCMEPTGPIEQATHFVEDRLGVSLGAVCVRQVSRSKVRAVIRGNAEATADLTDLEAAFQPSTGDIFLAESLDLSNPVDLSFLVHELVHSAQFKQGSSRREQPIGYLENEAYNLQSRFLKSRGFEQEALLYNLLGLVQATSSDDYRYDPDRR